LTIIDVNLLLYAYDADAPNHRPAKRWLESLFADDEIIGLPWVTIWGFLRLTTNPRIWPTPLPAEDAFAIVTEWLSRPNVVALDPGPRHLEILNTLAVKEKAAGSRVTDAVLAALAIENNATLASSDHDFRRFARLRWLDPLASD
jgi:toxin-antitoxin system PIN domain toxin